MLKTLRRLNDERGQSIVMIGLMSMFILGLLGIVADTGFTWMQRRNLQNAADSAALAAAQKLPDDQAGASTLANDYVTKNGGGTTTVEFGDTITGGLPTSVKVTVHKDSQSLFGVSLGFGNLDVSAKAKARKSNADISKGIIPVAVPSGNISGTQGTTITITSGVPSSSNGPVVGNIELASLDPGSSPPCSAAGTNPHGANTLGNGIECGSAVGVTLGQTLYAKPGGSAGPVRTGFQNRVTNSLNVDGAGHNCQTLDEVFTNHATLPWVINPLCAPGGYKTVLVLVPVISGWQAGAKQGVVTDLALFWIDPVQQFKCSNGGVCDIKGMWITNYKSLLLPSGGGTSGGSFRAFQIIELVE